MVECIQNDLSTNIKFEYNSLFEGELNQIMEHLHIFGNYLQNVLQVLRACKKIGQILRRKLIENLKICENLSNFMRYLSAFNSQSHIKRTNWCRVKSKFASQLFTFIFELYDVSFFLENMETINSGNELTQTHHDRCIVTHLIEFLVSRLVVVLVLFLLFCEKKRIYRCRWLTTHFFF